MSAKHTPGPWVVHMSQQGYPYQIKAINGDDKKPGAVGSCITRWASISLPSSDEGVANANLIAAAPCLLAALKALLAVAPSKAPGAGVIVGSEEKHKVAIAAARAAITKAEGVKP